MTNQISIDQALQALVPGTFLLVLLFGIIVSVILNYHWTRFEIDTQRIKKMRVLYFSVSGTIFAILVVLLATIYLL
jgi:hypothetical protein